jgi:hypothetical protein
MKRGIIFLLTLVLVISSVNALIISEIESNPDGKDSKNEWMELYSEDPINEEITIINNDDDELKVKFNFQGYYVYIFDSQWLDNSDEKVYLYNAGDGLIDQTNLFDDGEDTDFTWQRCDDTWVFQKSTREKENCLQEIPEPEEEPLEEVSDSEETEEEIEEEVEEIEEEVEEVVIEEEITQENTNSITAGVIKLDSKDIKSKSDKENVDKNKLATIGLGIIAFVLFILLISQRYRYTRKNEFR